MKIYNLKFQAFALMLTSVIMIGMSSCGNPIVSKIKELNIDGKFSCEDLQNVEQYILENQSDRSFKSFVQNLSIDTLKLNRLLKKELGEDKFNLLICDPESSQNQKAKHVHLYLENSGSMDGYVNGITDYEAALADLVVEAQHYYGKENLSINFINSEIIPAQIADISSFFKSLNPGEKPYNVGNKSVSELNELFKNVLAKTSEDDLSIFISDCIYSLDMSRSTTQGLIFQQSLTKAVFLEKSNEYPISAYVIQMNSSFSGKYFDMNNKVTVLDKIQRPYYIWILGNETVLKDYLIKHNLSKYQGFKNSYYFTNNLNPNLRFELLKSTGLIGRASFNRENNKIIDAIKSKDGKFQFAVATDLSEYPDKKTVLNKDSYKITPGFELVAIEPIPENNQPTLVQHNDWNKIANAGYTHVITINTNDSNFASDFSLSYINGLPKWVESTSTDDDSDIKNNLDKTFGLKYLIKGIQSAYESKGINSSKIELKLNK